MSIMKKMCNLCDYLFCLYQCVSNSKTTINVYIVWCTYYLCGNVLLCQPQQWNSQTAGVGFTKYIPGMSARYANIEGYRLVPSSNGSNGGQRTDALTDNFVHYFHVITYSIALSLTLLRNLSSGLKRCYFIKIYSNYIICDSWFINVYPCVIIKKGIIECYTFISAKISPNMCQQS